MRNFVYLLIYLHVLSCNNRISKEKHTSFSIWQNLKDSFAKKNLQEFAVDSIPVNDYRTYHKIENNLLDSTIPKQWGNIYLYSWQERNTPFIEFTAIIQEENRGTRIIYYVFNTTDSMLSATPIAWKNSDFPFLFETRSRFKSKDTLDLLRSRTLVYDIKKKSKPIKSQSDTSFVRITFKEDGTTNESIITRKKAFR